MKRQISGVLLECDDAREIPFITGEIDKEQTCQCYEIYEDFPAVEIYLSKTPEEWSDLIDRIQKNIDEAKSNGTF